MSLLLNFIEILEKTPAKYRPTIVTNFLKYDEDIITKAFTSKGKKWVKEFIISPIVNTVNK